jgi:restriction system protein
MRTINQKGAEYFREGNLEQVEVATHEARVINDLIKQIELVKIQWVAIFPKQLSGPKHRTQLTHAIHGSRTPREIFRIPILKALVEMGGRGLASVVVYRVG